MDQTPQSPSKDHVRRHAYEALRAAKAARFPFPIEGRIPNFVGAEAAARRLQQLPAYQKARLIKVNPDAPQLPVRAQALRDGKTVLMPSPRLKGGFLRLRPERVPPGEERRAASLSHCAKYGEEIDLHDLAPDVLGPVGLIVAGSTAVTRRGARAGKGEGYADLEFALLQEMGHPPAPVVTTVHPVQIVPEIHIAPHDLSLDFIVTPEETIATDTPYPKPTGIDWDQLTPEDLQDMPVLGDLRALNWEQFTVPDLIAPDLHVLFIGINPGRASAARGHNFAGPGNHFWRLLHDAGLTPVLHKPEEEQTLLQYGLGITNIVGRASRGEADLSWDELTAGGKTLRETIRRCRPRTAAFLGKNVYRAYAGLSRSARVDWGRQSETTVTGVTDIVVPNPSARSTVPYADRLHWFESLRNPT